MNVDGMGWDGDVNGDGDGRRWICTWGDSCWVCVALVARGLDVKGQERSSQTVHTHSLWLIIRASEPHLALRGKHGGFKKTLHSTCST